MRIARIEGYATAEVKHRSLEGWRLLIAQPLTAEDQNDGVPQLVIDNLGAGIGSKVIISSDGSEARKMVGSELSPARWTVLGVIDDGVNLHA
ncbi:EutN/CcmL family microcompartment protein [Kamptonema cortianum]|nr:EutN/CcmL family microcompartment protein [Oscillatoria laete-virens]MDK3156433.1 EutN/CcmL family microcompartment protein [Kamptonema cortianum]MDL5046292.1 EutN/CcmL family microcompartment protein [Oscillatoria amoena NRMC-F 0135]MDL5053886.1 EutN/CcmL family microcompartment protein [Oscillatoria laete-virens NRMC-F 0139]